MTNLAVDQSKLPPMLAQYLEYKGKYPDCLLFFQVGDFYELFFDDAVTVSRTLNLTLTSRDKNNPNPVPMCGVPIAVVDGYIERLRAQRYSVALVSQTEPPASGKGPVGRKLERIVTPAVTVLSHSSDDREGHYVSCVAIASDAECAIAFTDVQSGRILVREGISRLQLIQELQRIGPLEVVLPSAVAGQSLDRRSAWVRDLERSISTAALKFRVDRYAAPAQRRSRELSQVDGYSVIGPIGKRAVAMLVEYVDEVTVERQVQFSSIEQPRDEGIVSIDAMTRLNLELVRNSKDSGREGSLLHLLDATRTVGGAKLLRSWILGPLTDPQAIDRRQQAVQALLPVMAREDIGNALRRVCDLERIATRIELGVLSPREAGALRDSFEQLPRVSAAVQALISASDSPHELLDGVRESIAKDDGVYEILKKAIAENPPQTTNEGEIFIDGFNAELDELRGVQRDGNSWVAELERREREATGISSLKIRFNNVFGYYIEITKANLDKVPDRYVRRQTTVNSERFITDELKKREDLILGASDKLIRLERALFDALRAELRPFAGMIRRIGESIATLDVLVSLAEVADREGWCRPEVFEGAELEIDEGRHPIIGAMLQRDFVANSLQFGALHQTRCFLITGPNMGGKSTFLRQTALIVILAQIGSFVPARRARIGIVDKIFARIGAADNLREGESTFMVEMREASSIISQATERSLVLIDEIGRGTATLDGLALAQAILEWLIVTAKCRTLFATHFHELTPLEDGYDTVGNLSVGSREIEGKILFTHEIRPGSADRSYGLEVAELAGLPESVMQRARLLLSERIERAEQNPAKRQLSLFTPPPISAVPKPPPVDPAIAAVRERLRAVTVDQMTPLEALNALAELKRLSERSA